VIKRDLQVLSVRHEVSPTDNGSTIIPTAWQNSYFKEKLHS